jgi:hypothetical protein
VLADLDHEPFDVLHAGRVGRAVDDLTAWDCLVRLVRR